MSYDHQNQNQPWMKQQRPLHVFQQAAAKSAILCQNKNHKNLKP